jgi:hypothetical protein
MLKSIDKRFLAGGVNDIQWKSIEMLEQKPSSAKMELPAGRRIKRHNGDLISEKFYSPTTSPCAFFAAFTQSHQLSSRRSPKLTDPEDDQNKAPFPDC